MKPFAMSALLLALAATATSTPAVAQDQRPASGVEAVNAVYLELLGNGIFYSINYDRRFGDAFGARAGLGGVGNAGAVPITLNYLLGGTRHHLELGIGPLIVYGPETFEDEQGDLVTGATTLAVLGTGTFGYRFQPDTGGFVFRIGLTPFFSTGGILPWAGLSLGYAF